MKKIIFFLSIMFFIWGISNNGFSIEPAVFKTIEKISIQARPGNDYISLGISGTSEKGKNKTTSVFIGSNPDPIYLEAFRTCVKMALLVKENPEKYDLEIDGDGKYDRSGFFITSTKNGSRNFVGCWLF